MRTPTDATGFPGATVALLNGGTNFVMADLYTITLSGGGIIRYTGHANALTFNGNTFITGPVFNRGSISHKSGTSVATLDITIAAAPGDTINGGSFIPFVANRGFDGAQFRLERAFLPNWQSAITGTVIDFQGYITQIKNITRSSVTLTVSSGMVKLNVMMGPNLFQASCLNTLFDTNCTLAAASYTSSGTVSGTPTSLTFSTNKTQADGYFTQGIITFTSGVNNGVARSVSAYTNASGNVTVNFPFPAAPSSGDTFTIRAGCDRSLNTCKTKFASDNSIHFRGTPFIPVPETVI